MPGPRVRKKQGDQKSIKVNVEYYDDVEKAKLAFFPSAFALEELVENGLEIPVSDFLAYYLFHKKRPGKAGWRNYKQIAKHADDAAHELRGWVDFNGSSISTSKGVGKQVLAITERVGESIGLSVINEAHGLTDADWDKVPEHAGKGGFKTPDYQIAADEASIIQLETKGSSVDDNTKKTSAISTHKGEILKKKRLITESEKEGKFPYPADLRYGAITVIGENHNVPVRCLLLDPPADGGGPRARNVRLLHRMRFLRDWISFLSSGSRLATALQTKLASLENIQDPYSQDGLALVKGDGEPFDFSPLTPGGHSSFFANKSKVIGGAVGGICVRMNQNNLLFLGIREDLLQIAADQDFSAIVQARYSVGSFQQTIECFLSEQQFRLLDQPAGFSKSENKAGDVYRYSRNLKGTIHYSSSGNAFGMLPLS